jgi:Protein of unknown function (DUF2971)
MTPTPPAVLYKYYAPERLESFINGSAFFASPSDFNDTFDSDYLISAHWAKARLQRARHRRSLGVFCLTEEANNQLMWVHYAASHTGFVVGFNTSDQLFSEGGALLGKVDYTDDPLPVIPAGTDPPNEVVLKKARCWKYENEWRCIRTFGLKDARAVSFGEGALREFIFGFNMAGHQASRLLKFAHDLKGAGANITLIDSNPVRKTRELETLPTARVFCIHCDGVGHIIDTRTRGKN